MREKRSGEELVERSEMASKRVKLRYLDSVLRSEGIYYVNFDFICFRWVIRCSNLE